MAPRTALKAAPEAAQARPMKGAEIMVEYLIREKVPYLFGVCGHGFCSAPVRFFAKLVLMRSDAAARRRAR